jgi:hypothetical protein
MNKGHYLLLYIINPFFALLSELKNLKKTSLPYVLMFFCAFYGASQFIGEEGVRFKDASAYRDKFYELHDKNASWENFKNSLFDGETTFDLAIPLISYITSSFTRNARVFFFVCGLIFGYFYGKNIEFVIQSLSLNHYNRFLLFLFLVFALIIPFWSGLNGLRMWIGAHIFFYGASRTLQSKNYRYLIYIALAVLFHFSYITVAGIFFAFFFTPLKRYSTIYFAMFIVTFLVAESTIGNVTQLINDYTPTLFQAKTEEYTKEVYVETFRESFAQGRRWHALYYNTALLYSMFYLTFITYFFNLREKLFNVKQEVFLSFTLLLFSFSNLISQFSSGSRFYAITFLFALISFTFFYSRTKHKKMFHLAFIPLLFWMVVNIRDGFDQITLATFLANPLLIWFDIFNQEPLIDLIK